MPDLDCSTLAETFRPGLGGALVKIALPDGREAYRRARPGEKIDAEYAGPPREPGRAELREGYEERSKRASASAQKRRKTKPGRPIVIGRKARKSIA